MKEILKHLVEHVTLPEDAYLGQDEEILEIFVEELEEIFEQLQTSLDRWQLEEFKDTELVNIRRYFHTLKGSGRMVGAKRSGELAWTVEDTLNRIITKNLELTSEIQHYVSAVFNIYKFKLYSEFLNRKPHHLDLAPLVYLGQQLQQKQSLEPALDELLALSNTLDNENVITGLEIGEDTVTAEVTSVTTPHVVDLVPDGSTDTTEEEVAVESTVADDSLTSETLEIFVEESEEHLAAIKEFLHLEEHTPDQYNRLIRALHTLRGSSSMAHVNEVFEASGKV